MQIRTRSNDPRVMGDEQLRILVVEDDPIYADFVLGTLRAAGHDVDHATSGAGALAKLGALAHDAVILDLGLPDTSGYDIARLMRDKLPSTTVILVLTASLHPELDRADAVGIDLVLTKPIDVKLVTAMVDHVRERRKRRLERAPR